MPRKNRVPSAADNVADYRHKGVTRLNIPPAGLAARGKIVREPKLRWAYNPHLAPALRFDAAGKADSIEALIKKDGKQIASDLTRTTQTD